MIRLRTRGVLGPLVKLVIFLVVTSFATYVLAGTIANSDYGATYSYQADFTDASGVVVGDDVRVAGVRVGTVTGISIVKHNTARLSFTVSRSRPLPASVRATLRYRNLMGQRYLDIARGPGDSTKTLAPGAVIPVSHTHPAVDLTVLFQGFRPLFQGLNAKQINDLSMEIIKTLQGEGGSLQMLLGTLGDLTNTLADKDRVIGRVIDNLTSVLRTVGDRDTELSDLILQLQRFISGLSAERGTIGSAIEGVNRLADSTAGLLAEVRKPLARDITELTGLVAGLNHNRDAVAYVIDQLPRTTSALIRTASYGSWFNFYLCTVSPKLTLPGGATTLDLSKVNIPYPGAGERCKP